MAARSRLRETEAAKGIGIYEIVSVAPAYRSKASSTGSLEDCGHGSDGALLDRTTNNGSANPFHWEGMGGAKNLGWKQ